MMPLPAAAVPVHEASYPVVADEVYVTVFVRLNTSNSSVVLKCSVIGKTFEILASSRVVSFGSRNVFTPNKGTARDPINHVL